MTQFPFAAVGFDLDGTLLDTHKDLGMAVNHALAAGGFDPVPLDSARSLIGGGAKVMLQRAVAQQGGLDDAELHRLYKHLLEYYSANCAVHSQPFPGALECLDELAARGVAVSVVTNKFESFARDILTQLGLIGRFVTVIGGDTMGKGRAKPQPDPVLEAQRISGGGSFAFVGDSSFDVGAARAANVPVVVAAYGYCDKPPHELGGDAVIDSLDQLVGALAALEAG